MTVVLEVSTSKIIGRIPTAPGDVVAVFIKKK
jgi:hypothetical protein